MALKLLDEEEKLSQPALEVPQPMNPVVRNYIQQKYMPQQTPVTAPVDEELKAAQHQSAQSRLFAGLAQAGATIGHGLSGSRQAMNTEPYQQMEANAAAPVHDLLEGRKQVVEQAKAKFDEVQRRREEERHNPDSDESKRFKETFKAFSPKIAAMYSPEQFDQLTAADSHDVWDLSKHKETTEERAQATKEAQAARQAETAMQERHHSETVDLGNRQLASVDANRKNDNALAWTKANQDNLIVTKLDDGRLIYTDKKTGKREVFDPGAAPKAEGSEDSDNVPVEGSKARRTFDSELNRLRTSIGENSARSNSGQLVSRLNAAGRLKALATDSNGNPANLTPQQMQELAVASAALISNGSPAEGTIKGLLPKSMVGNAENITQWLTNEPRGANQQGFVKMLLQQGEREESVTRKQLQDNHMKTLGGYAPFRKDHPKTFWSAVTGQTGITQEMVDGTQAKPQGGGRTITRKDGSVWQEQPDGTAKKVQ